MSRLLTRFLVLPAIALALVVARPVAADTLSTGQLPNNGSGGIFMDLTAIGGNDLQITGFDSYLSGTVLANIEVWTRPGSYVAFNGSSAGWTLHEVITGTGAGTTTLVPFSTLANPINVADGTTVAVYLHSTTTGAGIRYFGTGTTSISNYNDANLALFTAHSRTGSIPFGGSLFTPRAFAGNIHYTVSSGIPEPSALGLLGIGLVAGLLRRRK